MVKVSVWKGGRPNEGGKLAEEKIVTPAEALHDELVRRFFWGSMRAGGGPVTKVDSLEGSLRLVIECSKPVNHSLVTSFVVFEEVEPFVIGQYSELGYLTMVAEWYAQVSGFCNDKAKRSIAESKLLEW